DVALDEGDLTSAGPAEVAVVGKHAAGERGILLVEKELEGLLSPDEIGRAHLPGECAAVLFELCLARALLGRECGATRGVLGALVANLCERIAGVCDRELRATQLARQPVALDLLGAHFACPPLDPRFRGLELLLGLAGIARAAPSRRREVRRGDQGRNGEGGDGEPEPVPRRRAVRRRGAIMRALLRP